MAADQLKNVAEIITASGAAVTAIGIAIVAVLVQLQRKTLGQVERQGNSVSLELKRVNMVYARRIADSTKDAGDKAIADEAQALYEASKQNVH